LNQALFLTVVYPECEPFLKDFVSSLARQTVKTFDVLLLNDGCKDTLPVHELENIPIIEINVFNKTPAQIREYGIRYAIEKGYKYIIFGDSDDWFDENRIEVSLDILSNYDIVVNDLNIAYDIDCVIKKKYFSERIKDMQEVKIEDVIDKNLFGLSNTAIKLDNIKMISVDEGLIAIDWFIYSTFLLTGAKACFTANTSTYYRQHSDNTIGISDLTEDKLRRGLLVKLKHYHEMSKLHNRYTKFYYEYKELASQLDDQAMIKKYLHELIEHPIEFPMWWEEVGIRG